MISSPIFSVNNLLIFLSELQLRKKKKKTFKVFSHPMSGSSTMESENGQTVSGAGMFPQWLRYGA
jgi:hypothetical protein